MLVTELHLSRKPSERDRFYLSRQEASNRDLRRGRDGGWGAGCIRSIYAMPSILQVSLHLLPTQAGVWPHHTCGETQHPGSHSIPPRSASGSPMDLMRSCTWCAWHRRLSGKINKPRALIRVTDGDCSGHPPVRSPLHPLMDTRRHTHPHNTRTSVHTSTHCH